MVKQWRLYSYNVQNRLSLYNAYYFIVVTFIYTTFYLLGSRL